MGYVTQLMEHESIAALNAQRTMEYNQHARRIALPMHPELEKVLLDQVKVVQARSGVRLYWC